MNNNSSLDACGVALTCGCRQGCSTHEIRFYEYTLHFSFTGVAKNAVYDTPKQERTHRHGFAMFTASDRTTDGDPFIIGSPGFDDQHEIQTAYHDPLEDVFGSAPASPTLDDASLSLESRHGTAEPSDVPRLRSIHVTNGYREGIAAGKEQSIQAGFDEGYALGAEYGHITGRINGVLDGLSSVASDAEQRAEVQKLIQLAQAELHVTNLFSASYFGQEGIWTYEVPEQSFDEAPFRRIASSHPLLLKWHKIAVEMAAKCGLTLPW